MLDPDKTHFFKNKNCHFVNLYLNSSSKFKFEPALLTNAHFYEHIILAILFHYF